MSPRSLHFELCVIGLLAACSADNKAQSTSPTQRGTPTVVLGGTGAGTSAALGGGAGVSSAATASAGSSGSINATAGSGPVTMGGAGRGTAGSMMAAAGRSTGSAGQPAAAGKSAAGAMAPPPGDPMVAIDNPAPKPSAGCGMAAPMAGNASIDVMGTSRDYILALPQGYDVSKPYKLIFAWHGLQGTAQQVAALDWYGLSRMSQNTAIYVAGQGLDTMTNVGNGAGWPNTNGQDVAFVKALYAKLQGQLCFDENRVFSVGMSYGGIMSNTLGCQMGDVFRAIAPMSGSGPGFGGRATCVGQVAVWMSHGDNDTTVPTASGEMSRDFWAKANHCQTQSVSVDPSPCIAFVGCDRDLPVTFCEFSGGHTIPPFAAAAIWKFFAQF